MGRQGRKLRAILDRQFAVVTIALFVIVLVGTGMTYTAYVNPGTTVTQKPGPEASYTGEFTHRATVEQSNPIFPRGSTRSNRRVYFTNLTPTLDSTFTYSYNATETGNVTVDGELTLVISSVDSDTGDTGVVYWRETHQLDSVNASLRPGEAVELTFARDVSQLRNESRQLDEAVGGTPGTIVTKVVADVETNGTVNSRRVTRANEYELDIQAGGGIYRVSDPGPVTNTTRQSLTVRKQEEPGPLSSLGGPLLVVVSLGGLFPLGLARYRGSLALSERERAYLTYETARGEFGDWITRARLPDGALDGAVVEVDSLEGLVDIAIDSDRRVIEDEGERFVVTVEGQVYRYTAPPEPGPTSLSPLLPRRHYDLSVRNSWGNDGADQATKSNGDESEAATANTDGTVETED